jgi:hypothetical protein
MAYHQLGPQSQEGTRDLGGFVCSKSDSRASESQMEGKRKKGKLQGKCRRRVVANGETAFPSGSIGPMPRVLLAGNDIWI